MKKITKREFIESISLKDCVLLYGGYTDKDLISDEFQAKYKNIVRKPEDIKPEEIRKVTVRPTKILFTFVNGDVSTLSLNEEGKHTYYLHENLLIAKTAFCDYSRCNFCIYQMI